MGVFLVHRRWDSRRSVTAALRPRTSVALWLASEPLTLSLCQPNGTLSDLGFEQRSERSRAACIAILEQCRSAEEVHQALERG